MANSTEKDYLLEIFFPIKKDLTQWKKSYSDLLKRKERIFNPLLRYLLSFPQKEIRPGLIFLSARAVSISDISSKIFSQLRKFAISIEAFNTALLIKNGVLQKMGTTDKEDQKKNSYALLFSDYLFSQAFYFSVELGLEEVSKSFIEIFGSITEVRIKEIDFVNGLDFLEDSYIKMIEQKTAKLMSIACKVGAELVKGKEKEKEGLRNFGLNFGLALQIVDDCLNVMDKSGSFIQDLKIERFNLPLLYLLHFLPHKEKEEVIKFLKDENIEFPRTHSLAFVYRAVEFALKKAKQFSDKAKKEIDFFPKSEFKESLIALADFPLERLAR